MGQYKCKHFLILIILSHITSRVRMNFINEVGVMEEMVVAYFKSGPQFCYLFGGNEQITESLFIKDIWSAV